MKLSYAAVDISAKSSIQDWTFSKCFLVNELQTWYNDLPPALKNEMDADESMGMLYSVASMIIYKKYDLLKYEEWLIILPNTWTFADTSSRFHPSQMGGRSMPDFLVHLLKWDNDKKIRVELANVPDGYWSPQVSELVSVQIDQGIRKLICLGFKSTWHISWVLQSELWTCLSFRSSSSLPSKNLKNRKCCWPRQARSSAWISTGTVVFFSYYGIQRHSR